MAKELLGKIAGNIKLKPRRRQEEIRRNARSAAFDVLIHEVEYQELNDAERDILQEISYKLMLKYFNGREMELLTPAYTQAEAVDIALEHYEEVTNGLNFQFAIAELICALDKFFKAHDKE